MNNLKRTVVIGATYKHCHDLHYRVDSVGLNVTGYEKGNDSFPQFVVYTQLEDGKFPIGTVWVHEEQDFLGKTTLENGRVVNTFELVEDKKA